MSREYLPADSLNPVLFNQTYRMDTLNADPLLCDGIQIYHMNRPGRKVPQERTKMDQEIRDMSLDDAINAGLLDFNDIENFL